MIVNKMTFRVYTGIILLFLHILAQKVSIGGTGGQVRSYFEYKYSFKPPYLTQKDGSIPFWEFGGHASADDKKVRLAPSMRSQKGAMWTKRRINFDWWEVQVSFLINGRGKIGADGMAFWYTAEKGDYAGDVYGSSDKWNGLGLFFDSFDNNNKNDNPMIMAVLNNGLISFDHQNDGETQLSHKCVSHFRNQQHINQVKIEYYKHVLSVSIQTGNKNFEVCFRAEGVVLPQNGYFGLSAATGSLADDHDVFAFLTNSLHPPEHGSEYKPILEEDMTKFDGKFKAFQEEITKQKEQYRKEHPFEQLDEGSFYGNQYNTELYQILQEQSKCLELVESMSQKIQDLNSKQERILGILSSQPQMVSNQAGGTVQITGTITRQEVDSVMNGQNTMLATVKELRTYIGEIHARVDNILANQARAPTAHIQATGYDMHTLVSEMRDGLNQVKQGVAHVGQRINQMPQAGAATNCPTQNCLSLKTFLIVMATQLGLFFVYKIYKARTEAQAKKFY